jgi:hypothetical protein
MKYGNDDGYMTVEAYLGISLLWDVNFLRLELICLLLPDIMYVFTQGTNFVF